MKLSIKHTISIVCLVFPSLLTVNAQEKSEVKPIVIDKEEGRKNIKSVVRQLKDLLLPLNQAKTAQKEKPPYLKVIEGADERSTLIYQCRNAKASTMVNALESIVSTTGTVEESETQNLVVINDLSKKMKELQEAVLSIDVTSPQVLVEAKIVEVLTSDGVEKDLRVIFEKYNKDLNITSSGGITLDAPRSQLGTSNTAGSSVDFFPYKSGHLGDDWKKFNIALKWLLSAQDGKILSSPNLIVSVGKTAGIITGEDIPIQSSQVVSGAINTSIEFKRVGVKLNVTPTMVNGNTIYLKVSPEVSQVSRYENFVQDKTTFRVPVIAIRNIETELSLNDGDIVMLGGLYSSIKTTFVEKPPILGEIPYIGSLFSSQTTNNTLTQLIFFLKINVLKEGPSDDFYDPAQQADEIRKIGDIIEKSPKIFPQNRMSTFQKISKDIFGEKNMEKLRQRSDQEKDVDDKLDRERDFDRTIDIGQ